VLPLIEAGKFERGLARKLPAVLAQGARVLELGAAVGFLAGHCSHIRPDLSWVLQEDNAGLRQMILRVCAINERTFDNRFALSDQRLGDDALAVARGLIAQHRPTALLIGTAAITPEMLEHLITPQISQLFLYGRWLEAHHAAPMTVPNLILLDEFDSNILRAYRPLAAILPE
jgi:hypothetical protein